VAVRPGDRGHADGAPAAGQTKANGAHDMCRSLMSDVPGRSLPRGLLLLTDDDHGDITIPSVSGLALDINPCQPLM